MSIFTEVIKLKELSLQIENGTAGKDFMVLENNDAMNGYQATRLETEFCSQTNKVGTYLADHGTERFEEKPELIRELIEIIYRVRKAVHAYRERMYQYATDWGSEISPVGNSVRNLYEIVTKEIEKLNIESRYLIFNNVSPEVQKGSFTIFWWQESDTHAGKNINIKDLFYSIKK